MPLVVRRPDPVTTRLAPAPATAIPRCEPPIGELAEWSFRFPQSFRNDLLRCYHDYLNFDAAAAGSMMLSFGIDTCGNTITPHAEGIAIKLEACIEQRMTTWRFRHAAAAPLYSVRVVMKPN